MPEALEIVHALYGGFFERGIRYFFPDATLAATGRTLGAEATLVFHSRTDGAVDLEWMGVCYHFERPGRPVTEHQLRLLGAIGAVLSLRYRSIFSAISATHTLGLFEGLAEDRYVSAFLDLTPYLDGDDGAHFKNRDVVASAIEVLRESSLLTYENRRISTGALVMGSGSDAFHASPTLPQGALPYNTSLVAIKSFHRLSDGLQTVFLVDRHGMLADLVDIQEFTRHHDPGPLPVPSSARYQAHNLATLNSGHTCLVLTPNGEIKVFSGGVPIFNFLEGRWRLTDATEKYREFHQAVGDLALAERLFTAAMNLAEHRRGGLFVVLDHPESSAELVAPADLLDNEDEQESNKGQIHYLLRRKRVLDIELSVLQSIAQVDGGIVIDRDGRLLAFGAILRNSGEYLTAQDGGRTTAAVHASRFGPVLKISEDGSVSFYRNGLMVWEI